MRSMVLVLAGFVAMAAPLFAEDGFQPLFNGKDLAGWTIFIDPKVQVDDPATVWSVEDGIIRCAGKPMGYIITDKEFCDYVLKLQWRWPAGTKGGNSGVLVHVQPPDKIWPKSVEAQLQHGAAGDFWLINAKLDVDPARQDPKVSRHYFRTVKTGVEKPIGEWNQYEITCQGDTIKLVVNGQEVNSGTKSELTRGKILLQSEGAPIEFRDIKIKELK